MKKLICMLLAILLCMSSAMAFAAVEYSLPEKWQRQVEFGNGVKGTVTVNASGDAEWVQMLAPLSGVPLQVRAIQSRTGDQFQYKLYAENGEDMVGLTQLYGSAEVVYLKSDLMDTLLKWETNGDLLNTLTGENDNNPALYSAMLNILHVPETSWESKWKPALSAYESSIELWLEDYASAPSVKRDENGATVLVRFDIPAAMVKEQIKAMWEMLLQDEVLLPLLKAEMTEEQQTAYLNPNLMYYYAQVIDALPLNGSIVLTREITARGEILSTDMSFPLAVDGWSMAEVNQLGGATTLSLYGAEKDIVLSLEQTNETPDSSSWRGELRVTPADAAQQGLAIAFALTEIRSSSVDEDTRTHDVTTWNLSMKQADEAAGDAWVQIDPLDVFAKVHIHSKAQQNLPVSLEIESVLSWEDAELAVAIDLITRSPWVLDELPTEGGVDALQLSSEELVQRMADMGLNGLTMLMMMNQQETIPLPETTQTDLQ